MGYSKDFKIKSFDEYLSDYIYNKTRYKAAVALKKEDQRKDIGS